MSTAEALGALDGVLAGGRAQMAVVRIDWKRFSGAPASAMEAPAAASMWRDEVAEASPRQRRDGLVARLEALAKSLKVADRAAFMEKGRIVEEMPAATAAKSEVLHRILGV